MSFRGQLLKAGIDSDGKIVTVYQNDGRLDIATISSETSGTIRSANFVHTEGANSMSKITEVLRVSLDSEYYTGDWVNAIVGRIDYGDAGDARGGMAAAICAEMNMPAKSYASIGGPSYSLDCEFNCPTDFVAGDRVTYPIAFLKFGLWGGAKTEFDAEGYLFHTDGLTAGSGGLLSENSRTLRVNIEGADKYIYLSDTEDDLGAAVFDTMVLDPGRIATGSLAGTAASLTSSYTYDSGLYLRYAVTDWTGVGSSFTGAYIRAEATTVTAAGKSVYGATIYGSTQQTMTTGSLWGALIYAYKKGSVTATINNMYAVQAELTWDADCDTTTLTTEAAIVLAKVTGGTLADYTKLHGQIFRFGDMNGGSRTYGSGIKLEDDAAMGGTCLLTTGLNIAIGCTTAVNISGAYAHGINFAVAPTAGDDTNSFINMGTYDAAVSVVPTSDNMFGVMHNVAMTANVAQWYQAYYTKITTSGTTTSTSIAGHALRMVVGSNLAAVYGVQSHVTVTGDRTFTSEVSPGSFYLNIGTGTIGMSGNRCNALQAVLTGGATVTATDYAVLAAYAATNASPDELVYIGQNSTVTSTAAIKMELDGTNTYAFDFQGSVSDGWTSGDLTGADEYAAFDEYALIPVRVKGVTGTLYLMAAHTWKAVTI